MDKFVIAIDGFAATGKSTLAKQLARHFDYVYVDTGAMYRAVTLFAFQNKYLEHTPFNPELLIANLDRIAIHFKSIAKKQHTFLNGVDVESHIRTPAISDRVSEIASLPEIRQFLVAQQRSMGLKKGIVMDGRDIGTVVFPDAECKFFLTATPEIRAKRRLLELNSLGIEISLDKVLENVKKRDHQDSSRAVAPLVPASDAFQIDVSEMSLETAFNKLLKIVETQLDLRA